MDTAIFYQSEQVLSLLSKFNVCASPDVLQDVFAKSLKDLKNNQCRISVLGVQGVGKSSFLNAVLFGDILLPVDADETTCIPTEVHYGDNATPKAMVVFSDGTRQEVACTEKDLAKFAHQGYNPANRQKISHIEISYKSELLKKGIILVDLPGVGSLTAENQKTTLTYIKNSPAAIFLLRSVPPMTNSESIFVQGALPLMNSVFWVQNQWTDESEEEMMEGCDHNEDKLKLIAKKVNKPEEYVSRPFVVCVKHALDGKIIDDPKMIAESNIASFMDKIVLFSENWRKEMDVQLRKNARELVAGALMDADEKKIRYEKILAGEEDKAKAELEEQYQRANQIKEENRALSRQAESFIREQKSELQKQISASCRIGSENLRNQVRELIDRGLTGGLRLSQAYSDCAKEINEEIFQQLQPQFIAFSQSIQQIIQDLKPVSLSKTTLEIEGVFSDKSKAPAHYGKIGVAAGAATGAAAGAAAGAAIGSAVPVIGNVVGGVIGGVLGSLFGGLFGSVGGRKVAEIQVDRQRETAREELFSQIETFRKELENNFRQALNDFIKSIDNALRAWNKEQNERLEREYADANKDFLATQSEIKENLTNLINDIVELEKLKQELCD